eukprot:TRINITY_DN55361_c0_g1_i1.p1 TRINITY_DN55361_c0_g1~~TRINITY_DN55361_c0_g1_i1.p1  ORF type:complete len:912 (+),score=178.98 TRINITY_DN55361_c0_g1_i1:62-2737(+)
MAVRWRQRRPSTRRLRQTLFVIAIGLVIVVIQWRAGTWLLLARSAPAAPGHYRPAPVGSGPCDGGAGEQALRDITTRVLCPRDPEFQQAIQTFNTRLEDSAPPACVAEVGPAELVPLLLQLAAGWDIPVAPRSGGHGPSGQSRLPGSLVLDMRRLNLVEVDPANRTAWIEGGTLWQDVYKATHPHGLTPNGGGCPTVGVVGSVIGGGVGWQSRPHGIMSDSLLAADVALPAHPQKPVRASDEVLWALRGGGHAGIAVVLRVQLRLYPAQHTLFAGMACRPTRTAEGLVELMRPLIRADERDGADVNSGFTLTATVDAPRPREGSGCQVCYMLHHAGPPAEGLETAVPLFAGVLDEQALLSNFMTNTTPFAWQMRFNTTQANVAWKSLLLGPLTLALAKTVARVAFTPVTFPAAAGGGEVDQGALGARQLMLEHLGGGMAKSQLGGAWPHRGARRLVSAIAFLNNRHRTEVVDEDSATEDRTWAVGQAAAAWTRKALLAMGGPEAPAFSNYHDPELTGHDWARRYWGYTGRRLLTIKRSVDPLGIFAAPERWGPAASGTAAVVPSTCGGHSERPLARQTCVVTGASAGGLGGAAGATLASLGCRVVGTSRTHGGCRRSLAAIGSPSAECLVFEATAARSVRALVRSLGEGIDVLVLNHGISEPWSAAAGRGGLSQLALVNVISVFLLAVQVLRAGLMRRGGRIIAVSCGGCLRAPRADVEQLLWGRPQWNYGGHEKAAADKMDGAEARAYLASKYAMVVLMWELRRRTAALGIPVSVSVATPEGVARTEISRRAVDDPHWASTFPLRESPAGAARPISRLALGAAAGGADVTPSAAADRLPVQSGCDPHPTVFPAVERGLACALWARAEQLAALPQGGVLHVPCTASDIQTA